MKNKVTIVKGHNEIHFYLVTKDTKTYLFSQVYTKGVYEYFRDGRSERELRAYSKWNKNPRLDKTIERIPREMKYVLGQAA